MNRRQKLVQQEFLNNEKGIIKRLNQVYGQALKDVNGEIERLMERFDPDTGDLMQSAVYQLQYQNMIKDQLEGVLNKMQTEQFVSVSEYLDTCYEDGFVGSLFDLHGQDVPLMIPLDQEAMVTAVQLDSKISQGLYTRLGEDVSLLKKRITAEVSRSIATGASFADTAKQLAGKTRIGYNNAIRIARTEGHRIQNQATMNVMEQAKDRGADIVKQWDATLDGKTRESHVAVDGEIKELDEKFSNGLRFPGDPSGKAAEVVNCRCALLQRARWAVENGFTKWNNFTKQLETFESPQQYDEFKKAFFTPENKRYMNYVQGLEEKYQTRNFEKILGLMSDREYKQYSKLLGANPLYTKVTEVLEKIIVPVKPTFVPANTIAEAEAFAKQFVDGSGFGAIGISYAGVHLDVANELNHALSDVFGLFDIPKLGGIAAPAKNTKLGKMVNAHAAYSPIRKSILLDRNKSKKADTMLEGLMADKKAITNILTHPEEYDFSKISPRLQRIIGASATTGRSIVAETVTEAITHEIGHHIERSVSKSDWDIIRAGMDEYATGISGYAVDSPSEYFAESFTSYMRGEDRIDPALRKIFEGLMK